ncbi:hypothetical protein HYR99_08080 [Candidatus Poribacteria bacterium]|nr:hypothetical protein [Candidatus Poribacteria bacterium]
MPPDNAHELVLTKLAQGLPAVTPAFGAALAEAGAICFEDQNHSNGVELKVEGTFTAKYNVYWQEVTDQMRRCWNDPEVTTEYAAYGIAFLLIRDLTEYTVISRRRKGGGFDYWLGKDEDELPFQKKARLEVSGIRKGDLSRVKARVKQKLDQVSPSDRLGLPAYIVVVEFSQPLSQVVKK